MNDLNVCSFTANVVKDAELRFSKDGTAICKFSVAVNKKMKNKEDTSFFNCVVFGKFGESVSKYLVKGTPIAFSAEAKQNVYEKDGVKHYSIDFIVTSLRMFGNKQNNALNSDNGYSNQNYNNNVSQGQYPPNDGESFGNDGIPY